ncbi:Methyltransferase domain-containing protein [Lentzea waywayandensis]|uniref:Methyltransferase domain-containing protein n=1 Tax=Lentzea waywayandensis TaxID=84724 RepID=A0A1I6EFC3_9PSEU|nr:class I SAM-dependent methyltransferase [Lentzea waywayandensis]SFR16357.1 Methyltransferase domain-containing protein [Lentzea waywayandensis]
MTWYTSFFTDLANGFWRGAVQPSQTSAEVDFLVGLGAGPRVLDAPCGSGRHSIELARRGYTVTGIDISDEAIAHARVLAPSLDWRQGDLASLGSFGVTADLAVCMGNSFGYLDHAGSQRFLRDLGAAAPVLVIDYGCAAEALLPSLPGEIRMSAGGVDMVAVNTYDVATARLLIDFTFTDGERTQQSACVQHVYTAGELTRMLNDAGFSSVELFGDTDGGAFEVGSHRLLAVARR